MEGVRFGIFDFSPSTGDLWRDGVPVRLQAQPARVLAALVARPGAIVTRDTLQREIWGESTHVDFERGLNFCIAQVRGALGDSAESPRFIETVPKQGYRFVAPVRGVRSGSGAGQVPVEPRTDPDLTPAGPMSEPASNPRTWSRTAAIGCTMAAVLIAAAIVWASVSSAAPAIVVIPFYNETGRPEHDLLAGALGDAAVARLATEERAAAVGVIGNAAALRNPFARQDVQQIARDLDAEWVLIGQLKTDGARLRVIAHLIRASDMKHLWAHTYDDPTFSLDAQTRTAEAIAAAVVTSLSAAD
jgi:DNA-binding winged helix-turn-helix (wHTH) protein/TolB-like protein